MYFLNFLIILILSVQVLSNTNDWTFIKTKSGVSAFKKHLPDEGLYAFKGEGFINHPIEKVVTVLLDNERAEEWVPKLAACKIIDGDNWPSDFSQYSLFDAPWPIKDRYFISDIKVTIDKNKVNIHYINVKNKTFFFEKEKLAHKIQGSIDGSHYQLIRDQDPNRTYFVATSVVRPFGKIPQWLINWAGSSMPFDTVKRLNKQLAKQDIPVPDSIKKMLGTIEITAGTKH